MRHRPIHFLALGGLVAALALVAQHGPAQQLVGAEAAQPVTKEAAPGIKITPSRVTAVTVYANSALVTREVDAASPAGRVELIVSPLPSTTVISSLYAEGTDGIRVLTTRYRTRPIVVDTSAEAKKLIEEIKSLQLAREKIEGDLSALQENGKMLTKMESFLTVTTVQATEKGGLNADQAIALAKHIRDARTESAKENVNLKQQIQANQEKASVAQTRLSQLTAGVSRYENDAVIVVDKVNPGAGVIRLNYLVENAAWHPQYKLRADKGGKDQVTLEYLAAVVQNTGEDWSNVKLVLSTAQPMLNATPPDLQTLHVAATPKGGPAPPSVADLETQLKTLRNRAQKEFNEKHVVSGVGLVNNAAAREQSFELFNPEAAVKRGCMLSYREGPTVTYRIATPLTVQSRADEQVLEVARAELKGDFYYKAVPILSPHAYRMAEMVNKSENVILPGEATMYSGTDFVGQMALPLVSTGESFTVGFGVDPQIQVARSMIDKLRTTSGGNQQLRYDYRIMVSNYKAEKVKLQVWDRLPFAENDTIGVNLIKTTPELSKDSLYQREQRPGNLLRWDVTADPNTHGDKATPINFEFRLELDRNLTIGGFQTAIGTGGNQAPLPVITAADKVTIRAAMEKLSPEDRKLAEGQIFCAVDQESALGTMGPILKVMAKGQPVFVCCKGCETEVKKNPDDALLQLQKLMGRVNSARK
ncbi:MAG: hypothetical protein C0467_15590 [Planctomycetaceae bacterium]|nr:hypothetical protein [Planctomycetaceae bacterium]